MLAQLTCQGLARGRLHQHLLRVRERFHPAPLLGAQGAMEEEWNDVAELADGPTDTLKLNIKTAAECFVCPQKKIGKKKWCVDHNRMFQSMEYRAKQDGEMEAFNKVMNDPGKAVEAFDKHAQDNPGGKWARAKLVDWTMWKRQFGVSIESVQREKEKLMNCRTYLKFAEANEGWDQVRALKQWKLLKETCDTEGTGDDVKVWVPTGKTRFRDTRAFVAGTVEQGSKASKSLTGDDVDRLKNFAHSSALSHSDAFFKENEAGNFAALTSHDAKDPAPEPEVQTKKKRVDLATASTSTFAAFESDLKKLVKLSLTAQVRAEAALDMHLAKPSTQTQQSYADNVSSRLKMVHKWQMGAEWDDWSATFYCKEEEEEEGAPTGTGANAPQGPAAGLEHELEKVMEAEAEAKASGAAEAGGGAGGQDAAQNEGVNGDAEMPDAAAAEDGSQLPLADAGDDATEREAQPRPTAKRTRVAGKQPDHSAAADAAQQAATPSQADAAATSKPSGSEGEEGASKKRPASGRPVTPVKAAKTGPVASPSSASGRTADGAAGPEASPATSSGLARSPAPSPGDEDVSVAFAAHETRMQDVSLIFNPASAGCHPNLKEVQECRRKLRTAMDRQTEELRALVKEVGVARAPVQKPENLHCCPSMVAFRCTVFEAVDVDALEAAKKEFKLQLTAASQLKDGLLKAAKHLVDHIQTKVKQAEREAAKAKLAVEKKEASETKRRTQQAAREIKNPEVKEHALFDLKDADVVDLELKPMSLVEVSSSMDDEPWVVQDPKLKALLGSPKVQLSLGTFAGQYKKSETFKKERKTQGPVFTQHGKEESDELFKGLLENLTQVDVSELKGGSAFMRTTWLFGVCPTLVTGAFPPNGLSMVKVLANGEVKYFIFEILSLRGALVKMCGDDGPQAWSLDKLRDFMLDCGAEKMKELIAQGCVVKYCIQRAGDAVHFPVGWLIFERVHSGSLVYGLRKSKVSSTTQALARYTCVIDMYQQSGRDTEKMKEVLARMTAVAVPEG